MKSPACALPLAEIERIDKMNLFTLIVILGIVALLSVATFVGLGAILAMVTSNLIHRFTDIPAEPGRHGSG